jgi:hypothetical protein
MYSGICLAEFSATSRVARGNENPGLVLVDMSLKTVVTPSWLVYMSESVSVPSPCLMHRVTLTWHVARRLSHDAKARVYQIRMTNAIYITPYPWTQARTSCLPASGTQHGHRPCTLKVKRAVWNISNMHCFHYNVPSAADQQTRGQPRLRVFY